MSNPSEVWLVHHVHEIGPDNEDVKLIGVYSSEPKAESAVARLSLQPGFEDHPDDFIVESYVLDKDHWTEGFITVF